MSPRIGQLDGALHDRYELGGWSFALGPVEDFERNDSPILVEERLGKHTLDTSSLRNLHAAGVSKDRVGNDLDQLIEQRLAHHADIEGLVGLRRCAVPESVDAPGLVEEHDEDLLIAVEQGDQAAGQILGSNLVGRHDPTVNACDRPRNTDLPPRPLLDEKTFTGMSRSWIVDRESLYGLNKPRPFYALVGQPICHENGRERLSAW